jgi:hypothetical protein
VSVSGPGTHASVTSTAENGSHHGGHGGQGGGGGSKESGGASTSSQRDGGGRDPRAPHAHVADIEHDASVARGSRRARFVL